MRMLVEFAHRESPRPPGLGPLLLARRAMGRRAGLACHVGLTLISMRAGYTSDILTDSLLYAEHARSGSSSTAPIVPSIDDVRLAVQARTEGAQVPKEVRLALSTRLPAIETSLTSSPSPLAVPPSARHDRQLCPAPDPQRGLRHPSPPSSTAPHRPELHPRPSLGRTTSPSGQRARRPRQRLERPRRPRRGHLRRRWEQRERECGGRRGCDGHEHGLADGRGERSGRERRRALRRR